MSLQTTTDTDQPSRPATPPPPAPPPAAAIMSGSVVVTNKATVVYPINQVKVQPQLSAKPRSASPGVITSAGKLAMIPGNNKIPMEGQKTCPAGTITPILATRIIPQRVPGVQQHTVTTSSSITPQSKIVINNAVTPGQIPITYEAVQVANHQQTAIIQGIQQIQTLPTGTVKTVSSNITGVSNLHRIQTNAKGPPVNFQKVKTITSVSNQTTVVSKNLVSRIQVPKSQITNAVHQMTPMTVNQVITSVNNAPRFQPNATITVQKSQVSSQRLNPGNGENHQNNKAQGIQSQAQKVAGPSQKAQNVPRQQSQSQQKMNSMKKGAVAGLQKAPIQNHQGLTNAQASATMPGNQSRSLGAPGNILKSDNSNSTSNSQLNVTKTSHAAVTVVSKNQTVVQQIIPQGQPQQQIIQKQLGGSAQRIQGNVNIQPKVNIVTQGLTSLPVNAKGSTIINAKIQQSQQQMLLRLEPGKSPAGNIQGSVKTIAQKGNVMKNSPIVAQQSLQRNTTVQPVKIIQQGGQSYPAGYPQGVPQKQPGCIKTIPAQKPQQRSQVQSKPGIKTSLNTNMNTLKTIGTANTTVITQKSSIKTLLPHQQNTSSVVVQKSQPIKIQSTNLQQKQLFVASQFAGQQHQQGQQQVRHGQIKTILPVTLASEIRKEMESKIEPESQMVVRGEYEEEELKAVQHSPVRRMPLPYECLQFVLQDHNYGAPPPRTPPPSSPPLKQQPINNGTGPALPHQSFIYNQGVPITTNTADDAASAISSEPGREVEPEGEETETAPEGEGDEEDSITRCICEFEHDDGYMICCDRCLVWQHVDCMGIDRSNIPDEYLCEICRPRRVDRQRARTLQMRKREELLNSDTSSDTSSTSSADTNVPAPPNPKKRNIQQSRKKAETPSQTRRLNNNNNESNSNHNALSTTPIATIPPTPNTTPSSDIASALTANTTASNPTSNSNNNTTTNNNNVTKRPGRREQNPRQSSVQSRKKEAVKRGPGKRKGKRRRSINDDDENHESWGSTVVPLRQWIERYEEAVTNHYSPELRARIWSIKVNGTHGDSRQNNNNMSAVASGKCRVNVHSNNVKYLMATMYLPPNTPVVELRGKYMLSAQHRPAHHGQGRQHAQRPGPFVFFYRLPRDETEVCVDTRTYGNDARFVRRSCTPNAEVRHCIEKGTLHLYIVTTSAIDKNAEITIRHEQHNLLMSPNSSNTNSVGNSTLPLACACGNPRTCQIASVVVGQVGPTRRSSSGASADNSDGRERRRRGRKNTTPEEDAGAAGGAASAPQSLSTTPSSSNEPTATGTLGATPKRAVEPRDKPKEEVPQVAQLPPALADPPPQIPSQTSTPSDTPPQETKKDKKKMTREERKMEAIMKAFERLEKAEQRKQEVQARNAQRKESGGAQSDNDDRDHQPILSHPTKTQKHHVERPVRRKRRKGRARTTSTSQSSSHSRRTRLNSADSDLSSADDDHLGALQSPPLRRPPCSSLSSTSQMYSPSKSDMTLRDSGNPNPVIPTAADLLLALANSNVPDAGRSMSPDRTLQQPALSKSPTCDSGASSSSQSSTPSTPLSSACLLVAAAVGPLAPGFKFPKTKKAMMNEWLRESPDLSQLPPRTLPLVSTIPVSKESPKGSDQLSSDYLNQSINYGAKSLATLVQAANSVSGICDSPPQRKGAACANAQNPQCPVSSGSAKKRWLRQAISEECDSPNSRPDSPPNETVAAPPKKRRIARESLSSDNYTPPTTPTPSTADCALMGLGIGDHSVSASVDNVSERPAFLSSSSRSLSPTTLERQIKSYLDAEMKEEEQSDMKKCEFYDICKIEKTGEIDEDIPVKPDSPQGLDDKLCLSNAMVDIKVDDSIKMELKNELSEGVKDEPTEADSNQGDIEFKLNIKTEIQSKLEESSLDLNIKIIENTVSVCDKSEEKNVDTVGLEPNDTETRLEFDNSSTSEPGISSISVSPKKEESLEEERSNETSKDELKLDEPMSLDEFDVEAQMKKITGDDGDDYKEKIESSSERDKSFDGIEGLMESSKEDSGSSDRDDDVELNFKTVKASGDQGRDVKEPDNVEERAFKEFETLASLEVLNAAKDSQEQSKSESIAAAGNCSSEESMFDSISNLDCESVNESPKIFQSIPPLSERIRKKNESSSAPKKQLDFEAAIIESTIDMESVEMSNGEHKTELSTALRQLLEGKVDQEPTVVNSTSSMDKEPGSPPLQHINESPEATRSPEIPSLVAIDAPKCVDPVLVVAAAISQVPPPPPPPLSPQGVPPVQAEVKRLKDPRTAPHERPPPDAPPPIKRKLSISEYRKRKQQSTGTPTEPEPANDASSSEKSPGRGRSDSASSGTSSLSSDEDSAKTTVETAMALTNLSLLTATDGEERKGGEEGTIGWSAAPTLVERQRENLTERLKREFGLFLSDDEEERARKQGLTAEAILKARKLSSPPQVTLSGAAMTYNPGMPPQLPPQPYIPPPGSAPIHYTLLPGKATSSQQYQNFTPPNPPPTTSPSGATNPPKQPPQFLMPQAPPGSNPYPPQFPPTASAIVTAPLFTPNTPPPSTLPPATVVPPQKAYFSNTHPPARS